MEGAYQVWAPAGDVIESFVAAPGPGGWRWFGRAHDPAGGAPRWSVDVVVDLHWRVVRFRMLGADGAGTTVTPGPQGLEVDAGDGRPIPFPGAEAVWSPSPSSVLVADRMLRAQGRTEVLAIAVWEPGHPGKTVRLGLGERQAVRMDTTAGLIEGERLEVMIEGGLFDVLLGPDRPLESDGWFRLAT